MVRMAQQVECPSSMTSTEVLPKAHVVALDKTAFEIDLSNSNAAKLREVSAYISAARRTGGGTRPSRRTTRRRPS